MTRETPRSIPKIVLETAARSASRIGAREKGYDDAIRRHAAYLRIAGGSPPAFEATQLFRWLIGLREALAPYGFDRSLPGWTVPVVNHRIEVRPAADAPSETLVTRLDLCLGDDERLVDHYEWLGDVRVRHGGTLNSPSAILHGLHPEMTRQIHGLMAEGQLWDRVVKGIETLASDLKDR